MYPLLEDTFIMKWNVHSEVTIDSFIEFFYFLFPFSIPFFLLKNPYESYIYLLNILIYILLKYIWFTLLCQFLLCSIVSQ